MKILPIPFVDLNARARLSHVLQLELFEAFEVDISELPDNMRRNIRSNITQTVKRARVESGRDFAVKASGNSVFIVRLV
jgi:hypothetical protein